jgi:predicted anti-sigma-YlaC factor YlaD
MSTPVLPSDCVRARESISVQLDSELSELDSARLSAHLEECSACSSHAHEMGEIAAHLRATPLDRPEVEIWLPRRRRTVVLRSASVRVTAAAAVVVVVVMMAAALSFVAGHYAATGGSHGSAVARPGVTTPPPDLVERQVLAMRRDARSRPSHPPGRLLFV